MRWLLFAATVLLVVALATFTTLQYVYRYITERTIELNEPVDILVQHGDTLTTVSERLEQAGIIKRAEWMVRYTQWKRESGQIQAGEYRFEGEVSLLSALAKLRRGSVITYDLQLPEGMRLEKYLELLRSTEKLVNDLEDVTPENIVARLALPTTATHGEGLFFPNTYQYRRGEAASSVLRQAFDLMQQELADAWSKRNELIHVESPYELLIVASLIERESHVETDRAKISGVIHRRLSMDMLLQIDPTVIYAIGDEFRGRLLRRHLRIEHPHNTYKVKGLPPSPICAASRQALVAAANPAEGDELYFVSRGDGTSQFSKTLIEHNRAVAKFLRQR